MKIATIQDLYLDLLRDAYNAETQLIAAIPKMAVKAVSKDLAAALKAHFDETREQLERLAQIFRILGAKPSGEECEAMQGIIEESNALLKADLATELTDAALIAAALKVEHYEIASYGVLCIFAGHLGHHDHERLLLETLKEEKQAAEKLTLLLGKEAINEAMAA
jgi:ferritin-like metal-binding protein YciE